MKKLLKSDLFLSMFAFFVKIAAGASSYLLFIFYSREMGAEQFGTFSFVFSVVMIIALVSNFGQQTFIVKEVPKSNNVKSLSREKGIYYFSYIFSIIGGLAGCGVYIGSSVFFLKDINVQEQLYGCLFILLFALSQTTLATLRINNKTMFGIITRDLIWRLLSIITFFILAYYAISEQNLVTSEDGMQALAYGLIPIIVWHLIIIYRNTFKRLKPVKPIFEMKVWVKASSGLALIALISSADIYLYTIVIAEYATSEEVGAVFASLKTVELLNIFLMAVTLIVSPKLSEYVASKEPEKLQRKCNVAIVLQAVPVIIFSIFIFTFSSQLLSLFDISFSGYSSLLNLLSIGMIINALTGATVLLLQLGNMHWRHVLFQGGAVLFAVALLPYFYHEYGIDGIAYSFILSKLIWNILAIHSIKKHLLIDPSIFSFLSKKRAYFSHLKSDIIHFK